MPYVKTFVDFKATPPRIGSGCNGTVMQLFLGCYFGCNLAAWQTNYQLLMKLYRATNRLQTCCNHTVIRLFSSLTAKIHYNELQPNGCSTAE